MNSFAPIESGFPIGGDPNAVARPPRPTSTQQLLASLFRQRYLALGTILAILAIGLLVTLLMPRTYTSAASVVLEQQAPQVIAVPDLDPQRNAQDAERFLQTQIDLVHSRTLARAVADQLKAYEDPKVLEALSVNEANSAARTEAVIGALIAGVQVELGLNTRLARIAFTSRDPAISANVANAFARQLVAANLTAKTDTSSRAAEYLKSQLGGAKTKLEESERTMLDYARSAGLTVSAQGRPGDGQGPVSPSAQLLGHLSQSMAQATARRISAQQDWQQIRGVAPQSLPQVQENRAVQEIMAHRAKIAATMAEEKDRYTSEYPTNTNAQVSSLNGQINMIAANIKRAYSDNYLSALSQEQEMQKTMNGYKSAMMAERLRSVGYNSLERDVETNKAFYDGLLQRYKEVVAAAGAPSINITLLDQATPALNATSPSIMRNMALALILALIAAMVVVLVRERTQNVIRSTFDITDITSLAFVSIVPVPSKGKSVEDALDDPNSPQSEAYNSTAVSLLKMDMGKMPKTVLVTSSAPGEGKSVTALGVARSLSRLGKRVLLVDGDLRHPSLADLLNQPEGPGFAEALAGSATPQSTIRHLDEPRLSVVCAGTERDNPVSLLSQLKTGPVLDQLGDEYDIVVIDGPPIMGLADAVILSDSTDAVVITVEANRIQTSQLGLALSRLPEAKPVGGVLTKFDAKAAGVAYANESYYTYA